MNLSERIKAARLHAGFTQRELAKKVGIAQTAISQLESGKTLRSSYLLQISEACGVSAMWIATGIGGMEISPEQQAQRARDRANWNEFEAGVYQAEGGAAAESARATDDVTMLGSMPGDGWTGGFPSSLHDVDAPFLREVEDPAGSGRTVVKKSTTESMRFVKRSLEAHGVQYHQAVAVTVSGNSMEPVLPDGATIGVNTGQRQIVDGKMYALNHAGQIRVRVLYRLPGGGARLRSFNQIEHPDEAYTAEGLVENSIEIIGRVFWAASFY